VASGSWYYSYIQFIAENEIMEGVGNSRFAPNANLSRAEFATILWRIAGEPATAGQLSLLDVSAGRWYSEAITWAYREGIIEGIGLDTFAPHAAISREEMAVMLFRYAEGAGHNTSIPPAFNWNRFTDRGNVSDWAEDAMRWAVHNGIIIGTSTTALSPDGTATRAQCATILVRYMETFLD